MDRLERAYHELADAVIVQAAQDYIYLNKKDKRGLCKRIYSAFDVSREEIVDFFYSKTFALYSDMNPDYLIRKLNETIDAKTYNSRVLKKNKEKILVE